jgi:hypothetical protein
MQRVYADFEAGVRNDKAISQQVMKMWLPARIIDFAAIIDLKESDVSPYSWQLGVAE